MKAVAYTRVSTQKQGRSGLGLEARQAAILAFADREGIEVVQRFGEVETGKGADALNAGKAIARPGAGQQARPAQAVPTCRRLTGV